MEYETITIKVPVDSKRAFERESADEHKTLEDWAVDKLHRESRDPWRLKAMRHYREMPLEKLKEMVFGYIGMNGGLCTIDAFSVACNRIEEECGIDSAIEFGDKVIELMEESREAKKKAWEEEDRARAKKNSFWGWLGF